MLSAIEATATPWPVTNGDQFYVNSITVQANNQSYTYDFGNLKWVKVGGTFQSTGFLPDGTKGTDWFNGTGGDIVSSDIDKQTPFGGTLKYSVNGLQVTAKGYKQTGPDEPRTTASVVQDHDNAYPTSSAGLGVYSVYGDNGDDNITSGELLTLSFPYAVTLSSATLHYEGHNKKFHPGTSLMFQVDDKDPFLVDLQPYLTTPNTFTGSLTGSEFTFLYTVPEPTSVALLVSGLAGVGMAFGRRRQAR